jgi:hypothetical protein
MHFNSSGDAGIGVCAPKGNTLKVMVQNDIQVKCNSYYIFLELLDRAAYIL